MSDVLEPVESATEVPEFLARLRDARYVSPGGTESRFLFDAVTRSVGKKTSQHEIADSDDSVLQDLGTGTLTYPMDVYFVGDSYDTDADAFFESLQDRATPDNPGMLYHPRWGDIPVIPFSFEQAENFTGTGVGMARVTVEFRKTLSLSYPVTDGLTEAAIDADSESLRNHAAAAADEMNVASPNAYSRFRGGMRNVVGTITEAVGSVTGLIADVQDEVDAVSQDINSALDAFAAPGQIISQVGSLVFGVADAVMSVPGRIDAYIDLATEAIEGLVTQYESLVGKEDRRNAAHSLQSVGAIVTAATAVAIMNTQAAGGSSTQAAGGSSTYNTRDAVGAAVDALSGVYAAYQDAMDTVYAGLSSESIENQFVPDHNTLDLVCAVSTAVSRLAINRAFDLKIQQSIILKAPSDPITLTWELYRDMDQLDFFCVTNAIAGPEFVEIPAGRKVVAYV
jgi:hypothetical protein